MPQQTFPSSSHAALLIDFDNVTLGIRSDLASELRNLLSSNLVQAKIAIQRAYADWRRYPQYVLPLTEASVDLIYAPAYGSARKNATDIRLAIDAMELVFTRPEIGTIILLSGDSDFSSLVIKLKEYGKYVIGVGIRESSSDLLVQNCDEYYSYNALAGLVKSGDEPVTKWDPWELAAEAVARMKRNDDVMRSDRLKQVMQEIDNTFDEKDLSYAKFSRFVQEAAQRGILSMSKLENGQIEVDLPREQPAAAAIAETPKPAPAAKSAETQPAEQERSGRDRGRRRRDRGRDRREDRGGHPRAAEPAAASESAAPPVASAPPAQAPAPQGDRLTRNEVFDLLRRSVEALTESDLHAVSASAVREKARELLGRDSETLAERHFSRILRDAHDAEVIDLRRRGDDFEVSRVAPARSVAEQMDRAAAALRQPAASATTPAGARPGARAGRAAFGKKLGEAPPDLLSVGVVDHAPAPVAASNGDVRPAVSAAAPEPERAPSDEPAAPARKRGGRKRAPAAASQTARDDDAAQPQARKRSRKSAPRGAAPGGSEKGDDASATKSARKTAAAKSH